MTDRDMYLELKQNEVKDNPFDVMLHHSMELTRDLLRRTEEPVRRALSDAKLSASQLDQVILIGGSTRMPKVTELIKQGYEILEMEKSPIYKGFIPDAIIKFKKLYLEKKK